MLQAKQRLLPGAVVAVHPRKFLGLVRHPGIVTGRDWLGRVCVISNSQRRGGVFEETLQEFAGGDAVVLLGRPDVLAPQEVIGRARSRAGQPWNLFTWNCEHFVNWAHGLPVKSPQLLQGGLAIATVLVLVGLSVGIPSKVTA
jgi:Lecithin retinol acyltransferase